MARKIEVFCENNGTTKTYTSGISLHEILADQTIQLRFTVLGAMVNNELEELSYEVFNPKQIRFIDITDVDGMRMYVRSLSFLLMKAVKDIFPKATLRIDHAVSRGYYCELENTSKDIEFEDVYQINERMRYLIEENIPFEKKEILTTKAIQLFEKNRFTEKVKLFKQLHTLYTTVYYLDNQVDYFYGYLVPTTGYLKVFDLVKYYDGMLLRVPRSKNPGELEELVVQNKMFDIFREYKNWAKILGVETIGSINEAVINGQQGEIIKISEALHERKVAQIAERICQKRDTRLVLISGPSASGKTTFAKRLAIQLKVSGLRPLQISLDNYFVDREDTPRDENGAYNFEDLHAVDIKLFNKDLLALLQGEAIYTKRFNFETGKRETTSEKIQITNEHILLVEGIHALNPELTSKIDENNKFKVYVSALTQMGIDNHNRIPTTDSRLIRRIVRDHKFRNYSAIETLARWQSVRRGEEENIFPYQEQAHVMFNSALLYELGVMKRYVEPLLQEVQQDQPEYAEALRLLKFLSYVKPILAKQIPPTSILREFLGKSGFKYS